MFCITDIDTKETVQMYFQGFVAVMCFWWLRGRHIVTHSAVVFQNGWRDNCGLSVCQFYGDHENIDTTNTWTRNQEGQLQTKERKCAFTYRGYPAKRALSAMRKHGG